jgi:hypothetical protein
VLNYLLRISPNKIIVATNNEPDNNFVGNNASEKIKKKLNKYLGKN